MTKKINRWLIILATDDGEGLSTDASFFVYKSSSYFDDALECYRHEDDDFSDHDKLAGCAEFVFDNMNDLCAYVNDHNASIKATFVLEDRG
jgi:hypothetical protein